MARLHRQILLCDSRAIIAAIESPLKFVGVQMGQKSRLREPTAIVAANKESSWGCKYYTEGPFTLIISLCDSRAIVAAIEL